MRQIAGHFPGGLMAFDTGGQAMIDRPQRNRVLAVLTARMHWACEDPRQLSEWGLRLLESRRLSAPQPELATSLPWFYRHGLRLLAPVLPPEFQTYKQNPFSID